MHEGNGNQLVYAVALLGAFVVFVPLFKRIGLGSVLGYLAAGLAIGPYGLGWFHDPASIMHTAELGVVMFLFMIGLEMQPSRLWGLRREIFGLGSAQVLTCAALTTLAGVACGFPLATSFVAGMGFVLSSTAIVMQLLDERGETSTARGQRIVSILLFEDLSIVPLLALIAFLAPPGDGPSESKLVSVGIGLAALVSLILIGRYLLSPLFRLLAASDAREVMTSAALLAVLGSALLMQLGGLSMALGAFLAGVLLSESNFRHQLESDIEPFRGILLGLFFLGVGMSLDLTVFRADGLTILLGVLVLHGMKSIGIYVVARGLRVTHGEALHRAVLLGQGGEFAFVLYVAAVGAELLDARQSAILGAIVILSMAVTPLAMFVLRALTKKEEQSLDGVDSADGLHGTVLIIGFGRFGQVVSQSLLARGFDVAIIDTDTEMIRSAADFGFKVYYGDGTRLDVLRASGAAEARLVAVCIDKKTAASKIVELCKHELPHVRLLVRAFDREHAVELVSLGVDYYIRETFESAMVFGNKALRELGLDQDEADEITTDVRNRDAERFALDVAAGLTAGSHLMLGNMPKPQPFTKPRRPGRALNSETAAELTSEAEPEPST